MSDHERRRREDGAIHEVSAMLGRLEARVESICGKIERVHERHDEFLVEFRRHVDKEENCLAAMLAVKDDIKSAKAAGEDWLKWKQRFMWVGGGIIAAGGAAGTTVNELLHRLRGWL